MTQLVASLPYDIRFLGDDYRHKNWDGKEIEQALGKQIYFLPRYHSFSSTNLKRRIIECKND